MAIIPRESSRRKKRTTNVASGLIAAGILVTGVYAIRHPVTFLRALSQVPVAGPVIGQAVRKSSHFLHNVGSVKDSAVNRLSRLHILERIGNPAGRQRLGSDISQFIKDVGEDFTRMQGHAAGNYDRHTLDRMRSPLEFIQNMHMGVINLARNIEHIQGTLGAGIKRSALVDTKTVGTIIDGIVDGASREDMGGISKIASKLGIDLSESGGAVTTAKLLQISDNIPGAGGDAYDDITLAIREVAGGAISDAERKILRPLAEEFEQGLSELTEARVGSAFIEDIMESVKTVGKTIKSSREEGLSIESILAADDDIAKKYKRGEAFLKAEVDPLVRFSSQAQNLQVTDLRLAGKQIVETETFFRTSFKIPFANINPLSIISPAGRQLRNQTHYWTPENLPHELHSTYGGLEGSRKGMWLINGKLYHTTKVGNIGSEVVYQGSAPRKYVAIEAGRYREMFSAMSGGGGRGGSNNVLREILNSAIKGGPVEQRLAGLLDTFDLHQQRQSIWLRMISFMTKGKFRPTNYYSPTFFKKFEGMSGDQVEKHIAELRESPGFDENQLFSQLKQYLESGIQGSVHDKSMDTGIGSFIKDISESIYKRADVSEAGLAARISKSDPNLTDENILDIENLIRLDREAGDSLKDISLRIEKGDDWLNNSTFSGEVMDALGNERVMQSTFVYDAIANQGGDVSNLNELRRVSKLWSDNKHNLIQELYTVGQGTQTINPMEHPQMFSFAERAERALQRAVAGTAYLDPATMASASDIDRLNRLVSLNNIDSAIQAASVAGDGPLTWFMFGRSEIAKGTDGMSFAVKKTLSKRFEHTWEQVKRIQESRKVFGINTDVGLGGYMDFDDELRYGSLYSTSRQVAHPGGGPGYEIGVVAETYFDPFHFARAAYDETNTTLQNRLSEFLSNDREFGDFVLSEWNLLKSGAKRFTEEYSRGRNELLTGYFRQFFPNQPHQVTAASVSLYNIASSLSHMFDPVGLGFGSRTYAKGPGGIISSMFFNRAVPLIGAAMLYNWTDRELEAITGSGLDDRISKQVAGGRIGVAALRDITGMTAVTKYMYETFPGMDFIGKELVGTIPVIGDIGLNIGLDESAKELQEFYAGGYVPVRSGRWWLASKTPWGGKRISGYQPNWYMRERDNVVRTKELQKQERLHSMIPSITPGPGWNPLSPLAGLLDPYWKERFYYKERPYPVSGPLMNPTTPGSGIVNATLGNVFKPRIALHPKEMKEARENLAAIAPGYEPDIDETGSWNTGGMGMLGFQHGGTPTGGSSGSGVAMSVDPLTARIGNATNATYLENSIWSPGNPIYQLGLAEYQTTELIGLKGFAFSLIKPNIGTSHPVEEEFNVGTIEQNWWGANIGSGPIPSAAMQETTELLRRFWPHERREVPKYNPLRNTQPTWMPDGTEYFEDFLHGDPYSRGKVPREGMLAGPGFENIWADELGDLMYKNVRASMIGYDYDKQVKYFTGYEDPERGGVDYASMGDKIHSAIQSKLATAGVLTEAERFVRDPSSGATGHIDVVADFGKGEEIIEIKALSSNRYKNLPAGGYREHISQLNFYLKTQAMSSGYLFYVSMKDHSQTQMIEIDYDPLMYTRDIARARRAKDEAQRIMDSGAISPYQSYSHIARAMVLATTAPWSDEFKEEWDYAIAENPDIPWVGTMLSRFKNMADAMKERHRFTPYKYLGVPDPEDADLFQRVAGPAWELFAHMDTPFHTKFLPAKSPLESYERDYIYGEDFGDWGQPVERWIKPMAQSLASKSPLYAIPFGATIGWMFGNNRGGGMAGARTGAIVAGVLSITGSVYEGISGKQYIPGDVRKNRKVNEYFDRLKYLKWSSINNKQSNYEAQQNIARTSYGMDPNAGTAIYAITPSERSYIRAFQNEPNAKNRTTIMQMVSRPGRRLLQATWGLPDEGPGEDMVEYFSKHHLPDPDWAGWQPDTNIDDYKVAYLDYQGLDAHDFGIWEEDQSRVHVRGTRFEKSLSKANFFNKTGARNYAEKIMLQLGMTQGQIVHNVGTNDTRQEIQIDVRKDVTDEVYNQIINGNIRANL